MAQVIGQGVSLRGIFVEEFQFPFNVASGITRDDEGKAVTVDTTSDNTVKLAGDGDPIVGRLAIVENRQVEGINVGTVSLKGGMALPTDGSTVNVGDTVVGSTTAGKVKSAAAVDYNNNFVVEVDAANNLVTVVKA